MMKLFVGSLAWTTTDDTLQAHFATLGTVVSAKVILDKFSGRSKGFGFVEMSTDEEAKEAIEKLNGSELDGRPIVVNEAKPMVPRDNNFRGGGGGGGGGFRRNDRNDRGSY